eukprot:TRINITY_DN10899_c0_g1_i1.p1 TRINITY_DN10899_c0_g1~~TRINITY_DN10899_c0_g1_i1.p1  ORF type:complete len:1125 (+),score=157.72 TRINITY_DN10899_c0_g1_i1:80-3454(+)
MGSCCGTKRQELQLDDADAQGDRLAVEELLADASAKGGYSVELSISCRKLPESQDILKQLSTWGLGGKMSCFCVVWSHTEGEDFETTKQLVGRTETVRDSQNPDFCSAVIASYRPGDEEREGPQVLTFEVYDENKPDGALLDQNYLGQHSVTLKALTEHKGGVHMGKVVDRRKHLHRRLQLTDVGNLALGGVGKLTFFFLDLFKDMYSLAMTGERREKGVIPELHVTAEHAHNVQEEVLLHFTGRGLDRPLTPFGFKAAIGNYFFQICRLQRNKIIPVARSPVTTMLMTKNAIRHGIDPEWEPMKFKTYRLCGAIIGDLSQNHGANSNHHCPLIVQVWHRDNFDFDRNQLIGSARVTLAELRSGTVNRLTLRSTHPASSGGYETSGELIVQKASLLTSFSFLHYLNQGGFGVNVIVAVDLSDSNNPAQDKDHPDAAIRPPVSLHALAPEDERLRRPNRYAKAIRLTCEILGRYDKGQAFPALGFGAEAWGHFSDGSRMPLRVAEEAAYPAALQKIVGTGTVFPLSFYDEVIHNSGNVENSYIDNIVEAYEAAVAGLKGSEPTLLAPLIRHVHRMAIQGKEDDEDHPPFMIAAIFTDGWIDDMTETVDAIVDASYDPVGLILVGIGKGRKEKAQQQEEVELPLDKKDKKNAKGQGSEEDAEDEEFPLCKRLLDKSLRSVVSGKVVARTTVHFVHYDKYADMPAMEFHRALLWQLPKMFLSWVDKVGLSLDEEHDSEQDFGDGASSPLGAQSVVSGGTQQKKMLPFALGGGGGGGDARSRGGSCASGAASRRTSRTSLTSGDGGSSRANSGTLSSGSARSTSSRRSDDAALFHDTVALRDGSPALGLTDAGTGTRRWRGEPPGGAPQPQPPRPPPAPCRTSTAESAASTAAPLSIAARGSAGRAADRPPQPQQPLLEGLWASPGPATAAAAAEQHGSAPPGRDSARAPQLPCRTPPQRLRTHGPRSGHKTAAPCGPRLPPRRGSARPTRSSPFGPPPQRSTPTGPLHAAQRQPGTPRPRGGAAATVWSATQPPRLGAGCSSPRAGTAAVAAAGEAAAAVPSQAQRRRPRPRPAAAPHRCRPAEPQGLHRAAPPRLGTATLLCSRPKPWRRGSSSRSQQRTSTRRFV